MSEKLPEKITLFEDVGTSKKGSIYIRGLHPTPKFYKETAKRDDFYWEQGTEYEENKFLPKNYVEVLYIKEER